MFQSDLILLGGASEHPKMISLELLPNVCFYLWEMQAPLTSPEGKAGVFASTSSKQKFELRPGNELRYNTNPSSVADSQDLSVEISFIVFSKMGCFA